MYMYLNVLILDDYENDCNHLFLSYRYFVYEPNLARTLAEYVV